MEERRIRNFDRLGGAGVLNNFVRRWKKELLLGANRAAPSTGMGEQRDQQVMADNSFSCKNICKRAKKSLLG